MTTEDLMKLLGDFPEINPSNYGDDDVNALNAWGIAAHTALEALGREVEQWKVDFNEVLIERDQARAQLAALQVDDELPEPVIIDRHIPTNIVIRGYTSDQLRQHAAQVRAKMVPLEKDAARYRWLRERYTAVNFDWEESGQQAVIFTADDFPIASASCDETIDAAMGITGEPK